MNRIEFMQILKQGLSGLTESEREEALQYYEDYLNDAGVENEQEVMAELGAPERLAETIKAGLNGGSGEYTERGYKQTDGGTGQPVTQMSPMGNAYEQPGRENSRTYGGNGTFNNGGTGYENGGQGRNGARQNSANPGNSASRAILIVLACIVLAPFVLPVAGAVLAAALGILLGLFGVWIGLLLTGVILFICGLVCVAAGIIRVFTMPAAGVIWIGTGLLCFGIGLLLSLFLLWLFGKLVPPFCRWIADLCRRPFERKGGAV